MKAPLALLGTLLLSVLQLSAWDIPGHMIVAKIAYDHTTPAARKQLDALGATLTFKTKSNQDWVTHTFNGVNIASWADEIKHAQTPQTDYAGRYANWHYIDLGLNFGQPGGDPDLIKNPPPLGIRKGNVLDGIKLCEAVLEHKTTSDLIPNEAVALALLVHLTGDIHQPLHCSANYGRHSGSHQDDGGGNDVPVTNFNDPYPELHQFWDIAYKLVLKNGKWTAGRDLSTFTTTPTSPELKAEVDEVLTAKANFTVSLQGDYFTAWALETHQVGKEVAYGLLAKEGLDYNTGSLTVPDAYAKAAKATAQQQLYKAGMRLAALLTKLYP